MKIKEYINRLVSITLKNKSVFQGVLIDVSEDWLYLKYIVVDYVMDGFVLINQRYVTHIGLSDDEGFKENILRLKGIIDENTPFLNVDNNVQLFSDLQSNIEIIRIEIKDPDRAYIGKIAFVKEHSFKVRLFSPNATWLGLETFLFKEIRALHFDEDYSNSLRLVLPPISDSK